MDNTCAGSNTGTRRASHRAGGQAQDPSGTIYNVPACPKGSDCSGCRATCDWDDIFRLAMGMAVIGNGSRSNPQFPAINTGSTSNEIRINPIGLTTQPRWEEFTRRVDIDNLFKRYAHGIYVANVDWPANNLEMWRYFLEPDERAAIADGTSQLHPWLQDERWRFISHDLEMGYGIWNTGANISNIATNEDFNTINALIVRDGVLGTNEHYGANEGSFMMRALLGGPQGGPAHNRHPAIPHGAGTIQAQNRVRLANAVSDLIEGGGPATAANMLAIYEEHAWKIQNEHQIMAATGGQEDALSGSRRLAEIARPVYQFGPTIPGESRRWYTWPHWDVEAGDDLASIQADAATIRRFIAARPANLRRFITTGGCSGSAGASAPALLPSGSSQSINITLNLPAGEEGHVIVNTSPLAIPPGTGKQHGSQVDPRERGRGTSVTMRYYGGTGVTIPITAVPAFGYRVDWSGVSGLTEDPLYRNPNRRLASASVDISGIRFVRCEDHLNIRNYPLDIDRVKAESFNSDADDWIILTNWNYGNAVSTKGMYLTDNTGSSDSNAGKWQMPSFIIPPATSAGPGELRIRTSAHGTGPQQTNQVYHPDFLKRTQTNFNLGFGERLRLTKSNTADIRTLIRCEVSIMNPTQVQSRSWGDGNYRIFPLQGWTPQTAQGAVNPGIGWTGAADPRSSTVGSFEAPAPRCPGCGARPPDPCTCPPPPPPPIAGTLFDLPTHAPAALEALNTSGGGGMSANRITTMPFLYFGSGSSSRSITVGTGTPRVIQLSGVGGRTQGLSFNLTNGIPASAGTLTFVVEGRATPGDVISIRNGMGSSNTPLVQQTVGADGRFSLTVTLTAAQRAAVPAATVNVGTSSAPDNRSIQGLAIGWENSISSAGMTITHMRIHP
jgi:hypothetical protein